MTINVILVIYAFSELETLRATVKPLADLEGTKTPPPAKFLHFHEVFGKGQMAGAHLGIGTSLGNPGSATGNIIGSGASWRIERN